MPNDAIRAALEAAHRKASSFYRVEETADIIAVFHHKMAAELSKRGREYWPQAEIHASFARSIEAAAREEGR